MATIPANQYCTIQDVQDLLSANGVTLATDDCPPNTWGNALAKAANKIDFYLGRRYDPTELVQSDLVKDWCAALAARYLRLRRGNAAPAGTQALYEDAVADLKEVQKGRNDIPGIGMRKSHAPGMSKMRATLRPFARAVVEQSQGTHASGEAESFHRQEDPYDLYGWNSTDYLDYTI